MKSRHETQRPFCPMTERITALCPARTLLPSQREVARSCDQNSAKYVMMVPEWMGAPGSIAQSSDTAAEDLVGNVVGKII